MPLKLKETKNKFETEKYVCMKNNTLDKFNKRRIINTLILEVSLFKYQNNCVLNLLYENFVSD